jgi:hypothetical protein
MQAGIRHGGDSVRSMATWDELKVVLMSLRDIPGALAQFPDPRSDVERLPPFRIGLAAWATDVAADLHSRFGGEVELVVGALKYPSCTSSRSRPEPPDVPLLDAAVVSVALDGALTVRSGYTEIHGILFSNRGDQEVQIVTNRQVTAVVVDPVTGRRVGGFVGAQRLPRQVFHLLPATTERIPLVVGTASIVADLGYAVPPGEWGLQVSLDLADRGSARTPLLTFTVV